MDADMKVASDLISLRVGEPDFPTPERVKEAGRQAIAENFTPYTPQPGFGGLREAIAEKFRSATSSDQIVVSCGGKHSLYGIPQCALKPGDEQGKRAREC